MAYKNILFDLDGTLTDPKVGITKSVQYALSKFGIFVEDLNALDPFIGPPLEASFMEYYQLNETQAKQAIAYYREYFSVTGIYENAIYPGIKELLQTLKKKERRLIVATSKPTIFAEEVLKYFKIDGYFDGVYGSNLDGSMVEKTEIIHDIVENVLPKDESIVMIGDRKYDIIGAHNNGIDTIAAGYGYGSEDELKICEPTYFVHSVEELLIFLG